MNYKFMNYALEHTEGNEFRMLYFIANTLNMKKASRCKIYSEVISDVLGVGTKTVTRITNALVEKGLLKKDLVSEHGKSKVYYSLNYAVLKDTDVQISTSNLDTDVRLNKNEKKLKKTNNEKMNEKEPTYDEYLEFEREVLGIGRELEGEDAFHF